VSAFKHNPISFILPSLASQLRWPELIDGLIHLFNKCEASKWDLGILSVQDIHPEI
jgi:hypothetical protein